MKNILSILIFTCLVFGASSLQADMAELADIMKTELQLRNVTASTKNKVETYIVKYQTAADGSHMHFGIWTDCVIGTVVGNAHNIGSQMIMFADGTIFDCSSDYSRKKDHFINKYPWGKVTSWDYKQEIERK